jgi:hypothetical protein
MKVSVERIKVGERVRKDMGDIEALAESIRELGLLQPIALWPDFTLAGGARRLEAVKRLGWEEVEAHVLKDSADLLERLKAERDENTQRKDFLPTELYEIGREIERVARDEAKERQATSTGGANPQPRPACGKCPQADNGKSRDKVGESLGVSGRTYEKLKAVIEAAEAEPETFGDLPARMDETGKVDGAFKEMKQRKEPTAPAPACPDGAALGAGAAEVAPRVEWADLTPPSLVKHLLKITANCSHELWMLQRYYCNIKGWEKAKRTPERLNKFIAKLRGMADQLEKGLEEALRTDLLERGPGEGARAPEGPALE